MQHFTDKVAVITGGAGGIGRAMAERFAQAGMKLVLADVEATTLAQTAAELTASGAQVLAVVTDVSVAGEVERLAQRTVERFGGVHVLCNNAGVGSGQAVWETSLGDWNWVLGVNLMGVVHGIHHFVPIMLDQKEPCHIVNTASIAGLIGGAGLGAYKVSKHGVVVLSEVLYAELKERGAPIGVSVLCPAWVRTRIHESERNRPADLPLPDLADRGVRAALVAESKAMRRVIEGGIPPQTVAETVFDAIQADRFYILTHPRMKPLINARLSDIREERNPTPVPGVGG